MVEIMPNSNMKVVILAGGYGTRISEETHSKPKPMIEIGDKPILWHIMKIYSCFGFNDFIICLGYKGERIKEYFMNYRLFNSDITLDFTEQSEMMIHSNRTEPWRVTLIDTGKDTMTGGRLKRIKNFIGSNTFMLTYGDGLTALNIKELVAYHQSHGKLATVTAVKPSGRFGSLSLSGTNRVIGFQEKIAGDGRWINGGFFVLEPEFFNYIEGDHTILEKEPLENLAKDGQLMAFKYEGFWHPMDTLRDKHYLEELWESGQAPWELAD